MAPEYAWRSIVQLRRKTTLDCRNEASFKSIFVIGWDVLAVLLLVHGPGAALCLPAPFGSRSNHVYGGVLIYVYAWRMTTSN